MVQGFALNDEVFMKGRKSDQEYFKRVEEKHGKQKGFNAKIYMKYKKSLKGL
ncbi:MAG TPA: hypothetical protein DCY94_04930 [Firmicutes bacterium]|nr:hypothetical protein [Bacillota bacterium]